MTNEVKPLDFDKVDALRRHMLLTVASLANLFDVTRVTYYSWLKGNKPHKKNAERVRKVLRSMAHLAHQEMWPNPAVFVADQPTRLIMLKSMLENLDKCENNSTL